MLRNKRNSLPQTILIIIMVNDLKIISIFLTRVNDLGLKLMSTEPVLASILELVINADALALYKHMVLVMC